jgi:hypothetical protein
VQFTCNCCSEPPFKQGCRQQQQHQQQQQHSSMSCLLRNVCLVQLAVSNIQEHLGGEDISRILEQVCLRQHAGLELQHMYNRSVCTSSSYSWPPAACAWYLAAACSQCCSWQWMNGAAEQWPCSQRTCSYTVFASINSTYFTVLVPTVAKCCCMYDCRPHSRSLSCSMHAAGLLHGRH